MNRLRVGCCYCGGGETVGKEGEEACLAEVGVWPWAKLARDFCHRYRSESLLFGIANRLTIFSRGGIARASRIRGAFRR